MAKDFETMSKDELINVINELSKTTNNLTCQLGELQNKLSKYEWRGTPEHVAYMCDKAQACERYSNYDYRQQVKDDLRHVIFYEYETYAWMYHDEDEFAEAVNDLAWTDDSVTGNGSGSYFFDTRTAAAALANNYDLLQEALHEFGSTMDVDKLTEYEGNDVTIRCYLLSEAVRDVIKIYDKQQYDFPDAPACYKAYTAYCAEHKDAKQLSEHKFYLQFYGHYSSREEAADKLSLTLDKLAFIYDVFYYENGVYLIHKLPKVVEL